MTELDQDVLRRAAANCASSMGRPTYERMGYRTVAEFTVWERDRPA